MPSSSLKPPIVFGTEFRMNRLGDIASLQALLFVHRSDLTGAFGTEGRLSHQAALDSTVQLRNVIRTILRLIPAGAADTNSHRREKQ